MIKKSLLVVIAVFFTSVLAFSQKKVEFMEKEYNFGKIKLGVPVTHNFAFENRDTSMIVIVNVNTSCGCTTPQWPKAPIPPRQKSQIIVGYNAANPGNFTKMINVIVEGNLNPIELVIKGEVVN